MSFLSELLRWNGPEPEAKRFNDGTFQTFTDQLAYFQGQLYQPYMTTSIGEKTEPILENFLGYVQGAYKSNGVVFGISMARMLLFSDVRFKFRRLGTVGGGNDLFGNPDLRLLERPWPGGTTQQLLTRAEQDVTTAGTFFLAKSDDGQRLLRRRPDWMEFILDAPPDIAVESNVIGYKYTVGGPKSGGQSRLYLAQQYDGDGLAECIHWSPIPDPEACYRGMSWLSPVVKEILADRAATAHKLKFFENAATPNLAIALKETVTVEQFRQFMTDMNDASVGVENAYKNLYLGGGADVTVIGANMQQMTFKETQGAGETRMCVAGRVPPIIVGVSEGLSSATYSNYSQARRAFGDTFGRPQWKSFAGAVAPLINEPVDAELWYDVRDVAFLREDSADLAANLSTNMATINAAVASGWTPESAKAAVLAEDLDQLVHSGLMSVQLQPPGADDSSGPTEEEQASQEAATVATQATAIATLAAGNAFDLESIVEGVVGGDLSILEEMPEPEPDPSIDPLTGLPVDPAEDPNAPLTDDAAARSHWKAELHPRGFHGKFSGKGGHGVGFKKALPEGETHNVKGLSDEQFEARAKHVETAMNEARKTHSTDVTHTDAGGAWHPDRDKLHREVAADIYSRAEHVPNEGRSVIAGGLGGAGKTTVLTKHAGVDTSAYLTINPDDIKEELVKKGLVPEIPHATDLSPMERSALIHEESSRIAGMVAQMAYKDKKNVMWDITMSSGSSVQKRVDDLKAHGYQEVNGVFVDIPVEVSVERAMARYRRGVEQYEQGKGLGGRYVPPAIIRAQRTSSGETVNRKVFDGLKDTFTDWQVYDNSVTGRAPQLVNKKGS